jgi:cleavage stimulation factor subunit 3
MTARAALKEMKSLTDPLSRPRVPVKPNWKRVNDHKQLAQWKAYLAWEEKNPLDISDKNLLNSRIQYAFRQATMHMRFYPEIWYASTLFVFLD